MGADAGGGCTPVAPVRVEGGRVFLGVSGL
jgi:hypothetical protein